MTFKKATFKIYGNFENGTHIKDEKGYTFDYKGKTFGLSKTEDIWVVTDLATGLYLPVWAKSRKDIEADFDKKPNIFDLVCTADNERLREVKKQIFKATYGGNLINV